MTKMARVVTLMIMLSVLVFGKDIVPEYEGVYLLTNHNKLIEVKSHLGKRISVYDRDLDFYSTNGKYYGCTFKELKNIPVIDNKDIKGFYVNLKNDSFVELGKLALLKDFMSAFKNKYKNFYNTISKTPNGYDRTQFRVKNINNFMSFFKNDNFFVKTYTMSLKNGGYEDLITVPNFPSKRIVSPGMYITTKKQDYPIFTTDGIASYLLSLKKYDKSVDFFLPKLEKTANSSYHKKALAYAKKVLIK